MLDALPDRINRYRWPTWPSCTATRRGASSTAWNRREAIGRPLDEFLSDDELEGLRSQLARLGPDNPVLDDTVARAVPNAPGQWLQWVDRYLIGPDGPEVLSIGRDVTERHIAELKPGRERGEVP